MMISNGIKVWCLYVTKAYIYGNDSQNLHLLICWYMYDKNLSSNVLTLKIEEFRVWNWLSNLTIFRVPKDMFLNISKAINGWIWQLLVWWKLWNFIMRQVKFNRFSHPNEYVSSKDFLMSCKNFWLKAIKSWVNFYKMNDV